MQPNNIILNSVELNNMKPVICIRWQKMLLALKKAFIFVILMLLPINCGLCESVLDKFMDDLPSINSNNNTSSDDGVDYSSTTTSYNPSSGASSNSVSGGVQQYSASDSSRLNDNAYNEAVSDKSIDAISQLSKIESENLNNLEFSLIGSDIINTYRYLAIGDEDRFAKSVKKVIMKSDNSQVKAQGYYFTGLLKLKEKNYKSAGQNFLDGYKHGQEYFFGAYNLFGLARTMNALEKKEESCAALNKLLKMIGSEDSDIIYPSLFVANVKGYSEKSCR